MGDEMKQRRVEETKQASIPTSAKLGPNYFLTLSALLGGFALILGVLWSSVEWLLGIVVRTKP